MKLIFLGTGTSQGVPVIGCKCEVCLSKNQKNKRLRPSVFIEFDKTNILIDVSNDFRLQMLQYDISHIDGVLLTHHHFDHISGIDDMRQYNFIQKSPINFYANRKTIKEVKTTFRYAFDDFTQKGGGLPQLDFNIIDDKAFFVNNLTIIPIQVFHGDLNILGFRINNLVYITDANYIPEKSFEKMMNLEILILNTLKYRPHPTHFNLDQSIEIAKRVNAKLTYFTHLCHDLEHDKVNSMLPDGIQLAYDGLEITI